MNNLIKLPVRAVAEPVKEAIRQSKENMYYLETERPFAQCPSHLVSVSLDYVCGSVVAVEEVEGQFIAHIEPSTDLLESVKDLPVEIVPLTIHHGDATPAIAYYTLRLK